MYADMRESPLYIIALGFFCVFFLFLLCFLFLRKSLTDFLVEKERYLFITKNLMQKNTKIFRFCHLEISTINAG